MSGPRPQDTIPWGGFRHESDLCPACNHCFVQTIESHTDVSEQNAAINAGNEKRLKAWESKGCEGQKLPATSTVSQILACYCIKHFSGGHLQGVGCPQCKLSFRSGKAPSFKTCEIYNCKCSWSFQRGKREDLRTADNIMVQARQFRIVAGGKKKSSDVSQDAIAITCQYLLHNPRLNSDVSLQNGLQKELSPGEVGKYGTATIIGDDISVLWKRSAAAKKAGISLTAMKLPVVEKGSKQEY
eukprot:11337940-Ditylum_brightwellii.AAC.1